MRGRRIGVAAAKFAVALRSRDSGEAIGARGAARAKPDLSIEDVSIGERPKYKLTSEE